MLLLMREKEPTTMTTSPPGGNQAPRDAAHWAHTSTLRVSQVPTGALNFNVEGRLAVGPLQGFGHLWQKTFRLPLLSVTLTPAEVMQIWKENFTRFQPPDNRFYPIGLGIEPGQIVLINATLSGMPLSTGVVVLYADEESFSLMTPQGHPESGWVTFSVSSEDNILIAQVQTMSRANDPVYELGFRLAGSKVQDRTWTHVLEALAAHMAVHEPVQISKICVDPRLQWSEFGNIRHNAAIHAMFYTLGTPLRWLLHRFKRRH
jgi:hypothetical protein